MLELLEIEIRSTMGLMGITSVKQLDRSWVRNAHPITDGGISGPYPRFRETFAGE